jgi:glycerophosphoryl diester phosphodiesterase
MEGVMRRHQGVSAVLLAALVLVAGPAAASWTPPAFTVNQLLGLGPRGFAIGHRGAGANMGEDPSRPIENTVAAVRVAFEAGLPVVEVDVQLTLDGQVAVFHDDFLPDLTCLNALTLGELQARVPHVPTLAEVLQEARGFSVPFWNLSGILIVELKPPAPLCDPDDTQEPAIAAAVAAEIRAAGMTGQVMLASFSPSLLFLAREAAPEITRILGLNALQFLTPEQVEALTGLPVTLIERPLSFGLVWGEVGVWFRLPGYASIGDVVRVAEAIGARGIEADLLLLRVAGKGLVGLAHARGLSVFGFTAETSRQWQWLRALGLDGIYTDDVGLAPRSRLPTLAR